MKKACFTLLLALATMVATGPAPTFADEQEATSVTSEPGGSFVAVPYARLLNTKDGAGAFSAQETRTLTVTGRGGVPTSGVEAVVLDISIDGTTATDIPAGIRAWTTGTAQPDHPVVRATQETAPVSNTVVLEPNAAGQISLYNARGTTHLKIDLQGYFTSGPGGGFKAVRELVADSGSQIGLSGRMVDDQTAALQVTGGSVPASATSVFVNVTALDPDSDGGLHMHPRGTPRGPIPNFNFSAGGADASGVIVPLDAQGGFSVTSNMGEGSVGARIEILGYFEPTSDGNYHPTSQSVLFHDTIGAGASRTISVGGMANMPTYGVEGAVVQTTIRNWGAFGRLHMASAGADPYKAPATMQFSGTEASGAATTLNLVKPGLGGAIEVVNTSAAPVTLLLVAQGWFGGTRAVPATDEEAFVQNAMAAGSSEGMARLAVWDEALAATIPTDVAVVEDSAAETEPAPVTEWEDTSDIEVTDAEFNAATMGDSVEHSDAPIELMTADDGTCADGYRLGKWAKKAVYTNWLGQTLWTTKFRKRWCGSLREHHVRKNVFWKVSKPDFTMQGAIAWNYVGTNDRDSGYRSYNGYRTGGHWSWQKETLEHCAFSVAICDEKQYRYWITGHYDRSKSAGGNW